MAKSSFSSDTFTIDSGVVAGQTIAKWTQDWWTWALNLDKDRNPFTQPDGSQVAAGHNDGPVFFFVGNQTELSPVPLGKPVLIPIINFIDTAPEFLHNKNKLDPSNPSFANAIHATENANISRWDGSLSGLVAKIDNVAIPDLSRYIVDSSFFDPGIASKDTLSMNPPFGVDPFEGTSMGPAKSGGAWLMVDNLTPGLHTVEIGGSSAFGPHHAVDIINVS